MSAPSLNRVRAAPFRDRRQYFHKPTRVGAWRIRLVALALLITAGWAVAAFVLRPNHVYAVSTHGELHRVHAPWANTCEACHVPHGSSGEPGNGLFDTRDRWRAMRCETCHPGAHADIKNYSPHYDRVSNPHLADDAQARDCSSCHHDHQGKNYAISRVSDTACSRCHENLAAFGSKGPPSGPAVKVTAFHSDHPDFRVAEDNRKREGEAGAKQWRALKFNHGLHLAAGLTEPVNSQAAFKLKQVAGPYQKQYERFADPPGSPEAHLRLDCNACHQLAGPSADPRAGGAAHLPAANLTRAPADGAYYLPVTFEQHCQACHQLNLPAAPSEAGLDIAGFDVPHRFRRAEVERFVRGEVTRQVADRKALFPHVLLPSSDRLDPPKAVAVPATLRDATDKLVGRYTGMLLGDPPGGRSCAKCHRPGEGGEVRPTTGFTLWMPRARFNHAAHTAMNCAQCHNTWAQPGSWDRFGFDPTKADEPVNVTGGIDNCRRCHAPSSFMVHGKPALGARHECVDCHRYHGRVAPPRANPAAGDRLNFESFLRGGRGQ